jgi:hypothetical protein
MSNQLILFVGFIGVCATIIFSALIVSRSGSFDGVRHTQITENQVLNSVSVTGEGEIKISPDMLRLSVTVSELEDTVTDAQDAVNRKINQIEEILTKNGIDEDSIQTTNLSINPEYDWSKNERELVGQRALQTLRIEIKGVDEDAERPGKIIDEISEVQSVQIGQISYDIEGRDSAAELARIEAFNDATRKAGDYATLSDKELMSPIAISDTSSNFGIPSYPVYSRFAADMETGGGEDTEIFTGEITVTAKVDIVFGLKE